MGFSEPNESREGVVFERVLVDPTEREEVAAEEDINEPSFPQSFPNSVHTVLGDRRKKCGAGPASEQLLAEAIAD